MISVCIITRDEQLMLETCLHRLTEFPVEIVVVDTGSRDDSIEIAKKYTDKVYSFTWCNDFSAARRFSIGKAENNVILVIDTDEYIETADFVQLEKQLSDNPGSCGRIKCINRYKRDGELQSGEEYISRAFDRRYFTYKGLVHEQVTAIDESRFATFQAPVTIIHSGYDGSSSELYNKSQRNIELIQKELESNPKDPYMLYQLGKSYYMQQDYTSACKYFEQATLIDVDPQLEYVEDLVISYGYTLLNTNQAEKAMGLEGLMNEFGSSSDFRFLMGLICMNNMKFDDAVEYFNYATDSKKCIVEGTNSYKAWYNIGVIHECLGNIDNAVLFYNKCGDYSKAKERLKAIL